MSNVVGPVCHIPPKNTPGNPHAVDMPGIPGPASPNDINSIVNLLNALRQLLLELSGQRGNQGQQVTITNNVVSKASARVTELSRVEQTVRVFQNNDPNSSNFVDVKQINRLVMQDNKTRETWLWDRNRGSN